MNRSPVTEAFDAVADAYDHWYDTPEGEAIFQAELKCLRRLRERCRGRWLEVGAGTGRFARALGVSEGLDPSVQMLRIAASRGIVVHLGSAESIPFPGCLFDGVVMVLTLCFVTDADQALKECLRVVRPGGYLLIGTVPADSPWGKEYIDKASKGHPIYGMARFRSASETVELVQSVGFTLISAASTLFWRPGEEAGSPAVVKTGIIPGAGFLGLLFEKGASTSRAADDRRGEEQ